MLVEFQKHLNQKFSFLQDKKILLAISGGVDSMVLLDLFKKSPYQIAVAHCNFNLRSEASDLDEQLVKEYCNENNIHFFVNSFNTVAYAELHKQSIQIAARELRYQWFDELLKNNNLDYLVTAHHLDDSVETFLINFTRGTGLDGLLGIPEINEQIVRPLLIFSRNQILDYAIQNNIAWREDASNATTKYLRNKIRHDIIPILKEKNADFLQSFQQTISNLNDIKNLADDASEMVKQQVSISTDYILEIDIQKLKAFKNYKAYLYQWFKDFGFTAWDDICNLLEAETGKKILSTKYILLKNRNSLILKEISVINNDVFLIFEKDKSIVYPITLIFESLISENYDIQNKNQICVDANQLKYPLKLRRWEEADYFFPIGMKGKKKVSKFFKDEKFSIFEKEATWILENGNQEIIWIVGHRMDNRYRINNQTINKIKINLTK
ncbi:tRNA lysidine(34) synthetase TilS [Flavobacterium sp. I3-2]|uniref:tRNA lysidine(34) synthetase TilS n=1 Tax=Flavobacterium sp. I3-2 TaxID=2748319 RepID=UPI0015A7F244|nr:tRNA lysidine(34) synthetase TilS [Flavobacterium sp. I3-2]